jgi:hypothetical protein
MTHALVTHRVVVIPELVFRYAMISSEAILLAHGIMPTRDYTHEHILVHGAPAHRYTQPPLTNPRNGGLPS